MALAIPGVLGAQERASSELEALLAQADVTRATSYPGLRALQTRVAKRISIAVSAGRDQPSRLTNRHESAARIDWNATSGYRIALLGSRTAAPAMGGGIEPESHAEMLGGPPLPIVPGENLFWFGEGLRQHLGVDPAQFAHPLAANADQHYRRTLGDSIRVRTPDGASRLLREVRITPRARTWTLIEGSLWLDAATGTLAAAQYRLAGPINASRGQSAARFSPARADLRYIVLENSLVANRWWLPRLQVLAVSGTRLGAAVDITVQHRFDVLATAAEDSLPARSEWPSPLPPLRVQCASSDTWAEFATRRQGTLRTLTTRPCDRQRLVTAPELPRDLFDADATFFGRSLGGLAERPVAGEGRAATRTVGAALRWGPALWRFDRVRGLSIGIDAERQLSARTQLYAHLRPSLGDHQLRGAIELSREIRNGTIGLKAFRTLSTPAVFSNTDSRTASIAAALLGRDPQIYHDALGVTVFGDALRRGMADLHVFAERQRPVLATQSRGLLGLPLPDGNPAADAGTWAGLRGRMRARRRAAPTGMRISPLLEMEAAQRLDSTSRFARVLAGAAIQVPLTARSAISLQTRAATSMGVVPRQQRWPLGGPTGVRGQDPERVRGDALWLTRGEMGVGTAALRVAAFSDIGWAGSRRDWSRQGASSSGGGLGVSVVDGLLRVDVSRGLRPRTNWRLDLQVETPF